LHLAAFVDSPDHVCCRYRLRAFEPALSAAGHSLLYHVRPHGLWQSLAISLPPGDACIIQRWLPPRLVLQRLRRQYRFLVFDFDDAVWARDSYSPKGLDSAKRLRRFKAIVGAADLVVAGNSFLADQAAKLVPSCRTQIIPTCVEPEKCPFANHRFDNQDIRLVWIGSSSTLLGLEKLSPVLEQIAEAIPGVRLKVICDRFPALNQMPVEQCEWRAESEAAELAHSDIGVAWMPDDEWSRGKCGLKILQYMAAGLPVVANRVGVHCEMVRHGESGFLADTQSEWIEAVRSLARDPQLRHRMGLAGRERVGKQYSVRHGANSWIAALDQLTTARVAA
jgi:glycosyltransferase involved in cell wall biosynthesis